jgi:hypothetical protein
MSGLHANAFQCLKVLKGMLSWSLKWLSLCAVQMLKAPQKLLTAEQAAYRSMPEAQMVGRRYALAEVPPFCILL